MTGDDKFPDALWRRKVVYQDSMDEIVEYYPKPDADRDAIWDSIYEATSKLQMRYEEVLAAFQNPSSVSNYEEVINSLDSPAGDDFEDVFKRYGFRLILDLMKAGWPRPLGPCLELAGVRVKSRPNAPRHLSAIIRRGRWTHWPDGYNYIISKSKPYSDDWFAASILKVIDEIVAIDRLPPMPEQKPWLILSLGQLMTDWKARQRHLRRVTRARKQETVGLERDRKRNAARAAAARAWEAEARRVAAQIWARNPLPSAAALAPRVQAELARRGIVSANGERPPSEDTIRKVIGAVKPRRARSGRAV